MLWQSFVIICSFNLLFVVESKLVYKHELDSMKNSSEMAIGERNFPTPEVLAENCTAPRAEEKN